ncbi:MAG: SAM-dependent chlorinase/fluorinase [Actinomycetes bacterium]
MIVIATDFGSTGPYMGQMKAVLAREAPGVPVIDLFADLPAPYPPVLTGRPAPAPAAANVPRPPRRVPILPVFLVLLGLALLLEEGAVLLFGLAALWWFASVCWRRAREQWAARWAGAPGRHGWAGPDHRYRC